MKNNKMFPRELYPEVPSVEDIIGVAKFNIVIGVKNKNKKEEYATPLFHFMVYKITSSLHKHAYQCACLELGKFHVGSCEKKSEEKDIIHKLLHETSDIVAEYIRLNVFENKNNILLEKVESDFMDGFWRVYRTHTLLHESRYTVTPSLEEIETNKGKELKKIIVKSDKISLPSSENITLSSMGIKKVA